MISNAEWEHLKRIFPSLRRIPEARQLLSIGDPESNATDAEHQAARQTLYSKVNMLHPHGPRLASEPKRDPFFELDWYRIVQIKPEMEQHLRFDWDAYTNRNIYHTAYYASSRDVSRSERMEAREEWLHRFGEENMEELPVPYAWGSSDELEEYELEISE